MADYLKAPATVHLEVAAVRKRLEDSIKQLYKLESLTNPQVEDYLQTLDNIVTVTDRAATNLQSYLAKVSK